MGTKRDHQPCWCGNGSDNTTVNTNGSAYCHACEDYTFNYAKSIGGEVEEPVNSFSSTPRKFAAIPDRKISEETCRTYGVKVSEDGSKHYYPYITKDGEVLATKVRHVSNKSFFIEGSIKEAGLFGQTAFKAGGKYITVVEGELDALAAHQMTGNKWPVVSLKNGAGGGVKDVKQSLEYLEGFDNIVLCFDMDEAGQAKVSDVAKLLTPGKCKIMKLPDGFKDACDMLRANKAAAFVQAFWNAEVYIPSGIKNVSDLEADYFNRPDEEGLPYPWEGLNTKTYGVRKKELVVWTGGTGIGKSSITRELEHHFITQTDDNVGIIALEEDWRRTIDGIVSIEAEARLHIKQIRDDYDPIKFKQHFGKLFLGNNKDRVYVHSHLGIQDFDDIMAKLRYLILGCDCEWIILDHLQMLISMANGPNEREIIDEVMLRLRSIVEETGVGMILVSHLRRTQSDRGHEQGLEVSLSHLRGSQSISQISDITIAAERNQQAEDGTSNIMNLRVLKNRPIGDTGIACALRYDTETGRLIEVDPDDEFTNEEF